MLTKKIIMKELPEYFIVFADRTGDTDEIREVKPLKVFRYKDIDLFIAEVSSIKSISYGVYNKDTGRLIYEDIYDYDNPLLEAGKLSNSITYRMMNIAKKIIDKRGVDNTKCEIYNTLCDNSIYKSIVEKIMKDKERREEMIRCRLVGRREFMRGYII